MDLFDILLHIGLVTSGFVLYLITFRGEPKKKGNYSQPGWNYPLKLICAMYSVYRWKKSRVAPPISELPREGQVDGCDDITIRAASPEGALVFVGVRKWCAKKGLAEITLYVKLSDGTVFKLPRHPDTLIGVWEDVEGCWSAGGLKIQVLKPLHRLRIFYDDVMVRESDATQHYVKIDLIWSAASAALRLPERWAGAQAARALALEPWRDGRWTDMIDRWEDGSWLQWGCVQGLVQWAGAAGAGAGLRCRGSKERAWAPHGLSALHRSLTIMMTATDGTMIFLLAKSYRDTLTNAISGFVRYPNGLVKEITSTDLSLPDFCEHRDEVPPCYTIVVTTSRSAHRAVLRPCDGGALLSGSPYQEETRLHPLAGSVDGERAAGLLARRYQPAEYSSPSVPLRPPARLRYLGEERVERFGYCATFDEPAASCPAIVGGKAASLALLASVQQEEGYKVPPGFCLTTRALERHLEANPALRRAVEDIERCAENYDETQFRDKCSRASELFVTTEMTAEVREEISCHLQALRQRALALGLGPQLRFAVRSSAVGEDGEVLSAAGQNETVLGCVSETDVVQAVGKCWASMFAFTSCHYRRQNGAACACGGGVVVQTLVSPAASGVMFTRNPDPARPGTILITANYGLGESVVSGAVEPDTFVLSPSHPHDDAAPEYRVEETILGSKTTLIAAHGSGTHSVPVSEEDRKRACLSEATAVALARVGARQRGLWGSHRDIEWAVCEDGIYLVQARPITCLGAWSPELLLHETDTPIMADTELTTFANTGEVMPSPLTALSQDVMLAALARGMDRAVGGVPGGSVIGLTHNRVYLDLYQSIYKSIPPKMDLNIRMIEMAVHGHFVADERLYAAALRRNPPRAAAKAAVLLNTLEPLINSSRYMKRTIKAVEQLRLDTETDDDAMALLERIERSVDILEPLCWNHARTSTASTASQMIAMGVLLDGQGELSNAHCNEISVMLSSGEAVSAEVPRALSALARRLDASGRADEFRALPPRDALPWLRDALPHLYAEVDEFLRTHGHRAIMEFDLATKPWALEPEKLMELLQGMRATEKEDKPVKSDAEIIASLTTPTKNSTRKVLSWLLPLCRRKVVHREGTKAHLILAIHKVRLLCRRLARLMVKTWLLPHEDLLFHFHLDELRGYLTSRDPALLRKATQRRQLYPAWSKLRFAEVQEGWPRPLRGGAGAAARGPGGAGAGAGAELRATPVCAGAGPVEGRAVVLTALPESGEVVEGDILVTHSTDIGWSPYFPLLAGIVTELGGLISHGAVIAREMGVACVVGATGATDVFRSGQRLRLCGATGLVQAVPPPSHAGGEAGASGEQSCCF